MKKSQENLRCFKRFKNQFLGKIALFCLVFLVTGCGIYDSAEFHDPRGKLTRSDYRHLGHKMAIDLFPDAVKSVPSKAVSPLPVLSKKFYEPVSLAVGSPIPLKEILTELTRQTGVDVEIDPEITGKSVFYAQKQPLIEVIERLCDLQGLRYDVKGRRLRVELDVPYSQSYNVQFLSLKRQSHNQLSISTDMFSPAKSSNGSVSNLSGESSNDFWQELTQNLEMLLGKKEKDHMNYAIHKQGGVIIVKGTSRQHRTIVDYLQRLYQSTNSQVLIEAKIIEVTLNEEYKNGINWRLVKKDLGIAAPLGKVVPGDFPTFNSGSKDMFTLAVQGKDMGSILHLLERFGTSRTLSNPRLTVMNNQPAILKVAQNFVYFVVKYDRQYLSKLDPLTPQFMANPNFLSNISSEVHTVPIGLVMVVQPSINQATGEVTLALRPTISTITRMVDDPAVTIASEQKVTSQVPIVEVREIDSVMVTKSGWVTVLGGLMQSKIANTSSGLPGADSIPFGAFLLAAKDDREETTELVILLRATIIDVPTADIEDQNLYKNFAQDSRPWVLKGRIS